MSEQASERERTHRRERLESAVVSFKNKTKQNKQINVYIEQSCFRP